MAMINTTGKFKFLGRKEFQLQLEKNSIDINKTMKNKKKLFRFNVYP
jgi:hypothetical protein